MPKIILSDPLFGIVVTVLAYLIAKWISDRVKTPLLNTAIGSLLLVMAFLLVFKVDTADYLKGGDMVLMLLGPATVALAFPIYDKRAILKKHLAAILTGVFAGAVTSILSAVLLCKAFGITGELLLSLIPKCVTTPIGIELSSMLGGLAPITVTAIMITGVFGNMLGPYILKLFRIKTPVAKGVALGTTSHAVGTSRAFEIGETEGAMSGLSIGIAGVITVIIAPIIMLLMK